MVKVKAVKHRRVKFRWAAPTATGGELTGYFAVVTKKGKGKPVLKRSTGPGSRSFTVRLSKLGRGRFKVRVFAINTAGAGPGRAAGSACAERASGRGGLLPGPVRRDVRSR